MLSVAVAAAMLSSGRPWMDTTKTVDERTDLLLAALTNQEKNAQLGYGTRLYPGSSTNASVVIAHAAANGGVGGIGCELPAFGELYARLSDGTDRWLRLSALVRLRARRLHAD